MCQFVPENGLRIPLQVYGTNNYPVHPTAGLSGSHIQHKTHIFRDHRMRYATATLQQTYQGQQLEHVGSQSDGYTCNIYVRAIAYPKSRCCAYVVFGSS